MLITRNQLRLQHKIIDYGTLSYVLLSMIRKISFYKLVSLLAIVVIGCNLPVTRYVYRTRTPEGGRGLEKKI